MTVAQHEAAHGAAAIWMRRRVEYVERDLGFFLPGERMGFAMCPIDGAIDASQMVIALSGYLAEGAAGWPPDYGQACHEPREALGKVIEILGLDRDQYDRIVAVTKEILDDPDFQRLAGAIERALAAVPRLTEPDIAALAAAANVPYEPREVTP